MGERQLHKVIQRSLGEDNPKVEVDVPILKSEDFVVEARQRSIGLAAMSCLIYRSNSMWFFLIRISTCTPVAFFIRKYLHVGVHIVPHQSTSPVDCLKTSTHS
jgi:hypothetical protein